VGQVDVYAALQETIGDIYSLHGGKCH